MSGWQQRYRFLKGDWPDPDSPAGRNLSLHDYHAQERAHRSKNVLQAAWLAKNVLRSAVRLETDQRVVEITDGLLPEILLGLVVASGCTLFGASLGAIAGGAFGLGAGAVPGAISGGSIGFSSGLWIMDWLGIAFLAAYLHKNMHEVTTLLRQGLDEAWGRGARDWSALPSSFSDSHHDNLPGASELTTASHKFARAVAVLIRLLLQSIVADLAARGTDKLPELVADLKKSRLGENFAVWVEKHHLELMQNPRLHQPVGTAVNLNQVAVPTGDAPQYPPAKVAGFEKKVLAGRAAAPKNDELFAAISRMKVTVDGAEISAQRVRVGSREQVYIIGRKMKGVEVYAEALRKQGFTVNTLTATNISEAAKLEFKALRKKYHGKIPNGMVTNSRLFIENKKWIHTAVNNDGVLVQRDLDFPAVCDKPSRTEESRCARSVTITPQKRKSPSSGVT